jgi:hypothetical protein
MARGELQGAADQAAVVDAARFAARLGERLSQPADLAQCEVNLREQGGAARLFEIGDALHFARPGGVPVDRLAILVQLRIGQQICGVIAQPPLHDAAELGGGVVQRLAAHAQRADAGTRGDDQRRVCISAAISTEINGRIVAPRWSDLPALSCSLSPFPQHELLHLPVEVMGRSRNTTKRGHL